MKSHLNFLISKISTLATTMMSSNNFLKELKKRPPSKKEIAQYLIDVRYLITFTQPHLRAALNTSTKAFQKNLAQYFFDKIFEEIGHEKWAEEDLDSNKLQTEKNTAQPTKSMQEFVNYLSHISKNSPIQYAVYILLNEYLMAHYGSAVLELFRATPKEENKLTVISKHMELDVEHASDDESRLVEILSTVTDSEMKELLETIRFSFEYINKSFEEIYEPNHSEHQSLTVSTSL